MKQGSYYWTLNREIMITKKKGKSYHNKNCNTLI